MRRYQILVVDDEEQFRTTICSCFPWADWGYEIAGQASNGKAALRFLENHTVDLVISDVQMPIMDGLELAETLSLRKDAPVVVFFSGYQEFEYARKALLYGVKDYIVKPVKFEALSKTLEQIRNILDEKNFEKEDAGQRIPETFIQTVQDYVRHNLKEASLSGIADRLYMNPSYVSQLYKQKSGENFSDYLLRMRMKRAGELLCNPKTHIYEVGEEVGYNNPNNFTRTFRNYYGMTPRAYQEKQMYQSYYRKEKQQ